VVVVEAGFALLLVLRPTPGLHWGVLVARYKPPCTIRKIWAPVAADASLVVGVPASLELGGALAGAQLLAAGAVDLVTRSRGFCTNFS
jgi:hypothetical protein